ncbi:MAG: hypothetical protein O6850_01370 [Acidobacteria bacterium]|nr:hypothetical protein [Acidobacteriota bacterium]
MATSPPPTWLEKQPDEVQLFVFRMEQEGLPAEDQARRLRGRFGLRVRSQTLARSLTAYRDRHEEDCTFAAADGRKLTKLMNEHPEIDREQMVRAFLVEVRQSPEFRARDLMPKDWLAGEQRQMKLQLEARRVRAVEESTRMRREQVAISERRVALMETRERELRRKVQGAIEDEKVGPEELRRRIREVYGLLDADEENGAAPSLPTEMGAG